MQKKLLMMGSNIYSDDMLRYARSLGVHTIVTDNLPKERSPSKWVSDEFWDISTADVDALEKKCREEGVNAVICGISEFNQDRCIDLAERLGLPFFCSRESWRFNRSKRDFKNMCRSVGMTVPEDYYLSVEPTDEELAKVKFPVVVKPVDQAGNKGLSYPDNVEELKEACRLARSFSDTPDVIVEQRLKGQEYVAYYVLADGQSSLLSIYTAYMEPGYPGCCYALNTTLDDKVHIFLRDNDASYREAIRRMGCKEGICWIQMFFNEEDQRFYAIEMGYRLPGDMMAIALQMQTGFDSIKWMVDCVLNGKNDPKDLPPSQTGEYRSCACAYLMWTGRAGTVASVEGLEEAAERTGAVIGRRILPGTELWAYAPTVILIYHGKDVEDACRLTRIVNDTVKILDTEGNDLLYRFTDFDHMRRIYYGNFPDAKPGV